MSGGLCLDALNEAGCPLPLDLEVLGVAGARIQARDDDRFFSYAGTLETAGIQLAIVFDTDSIPDDRLEHWGAAFAVARPASTLFVLGNEMDAGHLTEKSDSSGIMSPEEYAAYWHHLAIGISSVNPEAKLIVGGLVSGQVWWAMNLQPHLDPVPDGWDVHAYGKGPIEARGLYNDYRRELGQDIYALEWWEGHHSIAGFVYMLDRSVKRWCRYCWSDGMWPEPPMGLIDVDGNQKPEYHAFKAALEGGPTMAGQLEGLDNDDFVLGPVWPETPDIKDIGNGVRLRGHHSGVAMEIDGVVTPLMGANIESVEAIAKKHGFRLVPA